MSKSSNSSRSSKSSNRAMSNNSSRRAKPMVPKAGFTTVNDDGTINVLVRVNIDGEIYENDMIVPSYDWSYYWSYGASDAETPDTLLIEDLVKTGGELVAGEYKVETTKEKPYVWFVSKDELYFEQGGFEVNFNHYYRHYKHWYVSDKLVPGDNVYDVSIKKK